MMERLKGKRVKSKGGQDVDSSKLIRRQDIYMIGRCVVMQI